MAKNGVIPLFPLLGVNNRQPLIHMSKILVYLYTTEKRINQFVIGYVINPTLQVNKVFREKFEQFLGATFHPNTMENIIDVMRNRDTCVIALIMSYESKTKNPNKMI